MAQVEKSTIKIPTAAMFGITVLGILGNYFATRQAVQLEMNQIKNDIRLEQIERKNDVSMLDFKISGNRLAIEGVNTRITEVLKPGRK
jgi:hypothetical protein